MALGLVCAWKTQQCALFQPIYSSYGAFFGHSRVNNLSNPTHREKYVSPSNKRWWLCCPTLTPKKKIVPGQPHNFHPGTTQSVLYSCIYCLLWESQQRRTKISTAESEDRRGDRQNQHHSLHYITDSCTDGARATGSGLRDSTAASLLGWSGSAASSLTPVLTRPHTQPQDGPQTFQSVTIIPKTQPKNSNSLYSLTLWHS